MATVPPFPAPLPAWAKWGLRALPFVWGVAEDLLDFPSTQDAVSEVQWRRLVTVYSRETPVGTTEDVAVCTFDIVNITGGQVDTSWTTTDFTTVEGHMDAFQNVWAANAYAGFILNEYRWYSMAFANPMTLERRFLPSGAPVRITPKNIPGTVLVEPLPYQVAFSVTERTSIPRHWGRFYLPGFTANATSAANAGRWEASTIGTIANAAETLYAACAAAELFFVVPSTQQDNILGPALLGVTNIQIDDVPDTIRRRRPKQTLIRQIEPPLS